MTRTNPVIKSFANVTISETLTDVTVSGIKMQTTGYVYQMLLNKTVADPDALITYQHLKRFYNPFCDSLAAVYTAQVAYQILSTDISFS